MAASDAKKYREALKSKARRLAGEKDQKVDSSDWTPPEALNADVKTGARPVGAGARLYKKGGKVSGAGVKARADRPGRKAGGRTLQKDIGEGMANKDVRAANEERDGKKHIGGFKKGGRTKKDFGGALKNLATSGVLGLGGKLIGDAAKRGDDERDDSNWRNAQMAAAMTNRKSGGKVKDAGVAEKAALGKIDPKAKRAATPKPYKKGGKIHKAGGGELPSPEEALKSAERLKEVRREESKPQSFSKEQQQSYEREEGYNAADRDARKKGGRKERAYGGALMGAKKKPSRAKGKTDIHINIQTGPKAPMLPPGMMPPPPPGGDGMIPVPTPPAGGMPPMPPGMAAGAPPMPMPPGGGAGGPPPGLMPPPGRKAGGRISKVASSYKDMEAGAATGEGRLQKTDIAKKHKDAPARKAGGRAMRSFKDMTAGAESGPGRLQKTAIEKSQRLQGV